MDKCSKCDEYAEGFLMPTYEGEIDGDCGHEREDETLSFVCSHCLLKEINKLHSISTLLNGVKIK